MKTGRLNSVSPSGPVGTVTPVGVDVTATTSVSVSVPMPSTGDVITGGVTGSTVTGAGWSGSSGGIFDVPNGSTPSSGGAGRWRSGLGLPDRRNPELRVAENVCHQHTVLLSLSFDRGRGARARLPQSLGRRRPAAPPPRENAPERLTAP